MEDYEQNYLWAFHFYSLFLKEAGSQTFFQVDRQERAKISRLKGHYEMTAVAARRILQQISYQNFAHVYPQLISADVQLQLCLIYSLSILENNTFDIETRVQQIDKETQRYFFEYRSFGRCYIFEKYSLLNQFSLSWCAGFSNLPIF